MTDVTIVARSYTVRQPRNLQLIAQILASLAAVLPALASFSEEERCAVTEAAELEIGSARQAYVEGDEELYPTAFHIALAHKL